LSSSATSPSPSAARPSPPSPPLPYTTPFRSVAADGMALTKVARKALMAKQMATTTLVRPVRPPAPMPEALSTKVVVLEVPKMERSEEHTSELQSRFDLVCRLLLAPQKNNDDE